MKIEELVEKDKSFDEGSFITKVTNMIKKIYNSITLDELDHVKHFMTEELYQKYENEIIDSKNRNTRLIYDEVNVVSNIKNIIEEESSFAIYVEVSAKYLKYYLSLDNGNFVSGDMNQRMIDNHTYVFRKRKDAKTTSNHKCPGCGSNINVAATGICPYCGSVYNLVEYDYVLTDIQ